MQGTPGRGIDAPRFDREYERERRRREESESRRMTLAERQGGRMVEKGGRQRERERHTGEPSTQARSTWPFNIAPTRFLSLADNCTILLHSLVLSSLPPRPTARTFSSPRFPHRSAISLSHLPSSSNSLILSLRHLSHFHVASCCRHASCTTLPLVYPVASFVCATLSLHLFLARYSAHSRS